MLQERWYCSVSSMVNCSQYCCCLPTDMLCASCDLVHEIMCAVRLFCCSANAPCIVFVYLFMMQNSDRTSGDSSLMTMAAASQRWPLLIDPQQQATRWLKALAQQLVPQQQPVATADTDANDIEGTLHYVLLATAAGINVYIAWLYTAITAAIAAASV
jgi:ATP-binding dynein motor region